ncbi:hypothetical protein GGS26DRAFT_324672 [Hypomontagnella submonticulosa]|nr:hypothetical protein GGS26DRAFT_324672 [Hypomontagnella submonticulosa]
MSSDSQEEDASPSNQALETTQATAENLAGKAKDFGNKVADTHRRIDHLANNINTRLNNIEEAVQTINSKLDSMMSLISSLMIKDDATPETTGNNDNTPVQIKNNETPTQPTVQPAVHPTVDTTYQYNNAQQPTQAPYEQWTQGNQSNCVPYADLSVPWDNAMRRLDGTINLQRTAYNGATRTTQEEIIKYIWPEAVIPSEAENFPHCESKNRVVLPSNLKLTWADQTVFGKLRAIQDRLKVALVPYEHWPTRVAMELAGDFQQVAIYTNQCFPDWITFLETIFQVLNEYNALHSPISSFGTMMPYQDESILNFTRRLREGLYQLHVCMRTTGQTREILRHPIMK